MLHSCCYTWILIQQLNLVYYYPEIFWNTAYLMVESGCLEIEAADEDESGREKSSNYGTMATAMGKMISEGVKIIPPDINAAQQMFVPNTEENAIIYGLKGVMKLNNDDARTIIENRPYKSFKDFYERLFLVKHEVTLSTGKKQMKSLIEKGKIILLIKAGAFDKVEPNKTREQLLYEFGQLLYPPKTKLTASQIDSVFGMGIVPYELSGVKRIYNFKNYILEGDYYQDEETKAIKWYYIDDTEEEAIDFFNDNFLVDLSENRDYKYYNDEQGSGILIAMGTKRKGSFESVWIERIKPLNKWLNSNDCLDLYNQYYLEDNFDMSGTISSWEFEACNFYSHEHELINVDKKKYNVSNYRDLPIKPEVVNYVQRNNKQIPIYALTRICGTILDKNKNRHTITVLTLDGVVTVKFNKGQFSFYDKTISKSMDNGKGKMVKKTLESSWFTRGNKVLITGFRSEDVFIPKRYNNSIYQHTVNLITDISPNGNLKILSERVNVDDYE